MGQSIDPFDAGVWSILVIKDIVTDQLIFYNSQEEIEIIENSIDEIEKNFGKDIVTFVKKFDKFYEAEKNFIIKIIIKKNF